MLSDLILISEVTESWYLSVTQCTRVSMLAGPASPSKFQCIGVVCVCVYVHVCVGGGALGAHC